MGASASMLTRRLNSDKPKSFEYDARRDADNAALLKNGDAPWRFKSCNFF